MLFPTIEFAVFFTVVFLVSWGMWRHVTGRKLFLTAASFIFYGWWNWRYVFLLLGCCLVAFFAAAAIQRTHSPGPRKRILVGALTVLLGTLVCFKYLGFLSYSVLGIFRFLHMGLDFPMIEVLLPVGVSFFTFQAVSYVIDVYRRTIPASTSLLDLTLYLSFFPQLVAGPIVRAKTMLPQIEATPDPCRIQASRAFLLIMGGLVKKMVFASYIATELVDPVFENPGAFSGMQLILACYGYAVQIFCDFSAYSDLAIGVAMLLGFQFPENFRNPYRASSLAEFWQRWHISLSTWLRDYLFVPLAYVFLRRFSGKGHPSNDSQNLAYISAMMMTMLLGGLWHGAQYTFLAWGAIHGLGLVFERLARSRPGKARKKRPVKQMLNTVLVFNYVCLAWVFFRSQSLADALFFVHRVFAAFAGPISITPFIGILLLAGIAMHHVPLRFREHLRTRFALIPTPVQGLIFGGFLLMISALSPQGVAPFIYFRF